MAEIIVQGHKIETKEIWDVKLKDESREIWVIIGVINRDNINIGRSIPYDCSPGRRHDLKAPYERLYKEVKAKWEADKSEIPVFKL